MAFIEQAKELAAQRAVEFVEPGMVLGLGSGTTAVVFIRKLGERVKQGLAVRGIASSISSEALARSLGIPVCDFRECAGVDLAVDGADEIAPGLKLIKGGGGNLLREKIVISAAKRFVVVADTRKLVAQLGGAVLPVEVIPMAVPLVERKLMSLGLRPTVRQRKGGGEFRTDEGNVLLDCISGGIGDPEALGGAIREIVGVVEHGLFLGMADLAIVSDGVSVQEYTRESFSWS
jgi:ribose 5-phosphate isomerase A